MSSGRAETALSALARQAGVALLTALAYAVTAALALWLAAPPSFAAPLYPSAGIALVATLTWGRAGWVGSLLGAFAVNTLLGGARGQTDWVSLMSGGLIALGAAAQAELGARLVRRRLPAPRDLSEPRDVLMLFLLAGVLACMVSASVAVAVLGATGAVGRDALASTWLSWWTGDALGVLLGTPIALTLVGQPAHLWRSRRLTVALPMLALVAAVATTTLLVGRGDAQRLRSAFERDATRTADVFDWGLRTPLHALEAMHGLYLASDDVTVAEFDLAAQAWLQESPYLVALGFGERLMRADLAETQARIAAHDGRAWRVFNRADAPPSLTADDEDVVAMRRITPLGPNQVALGVNQLSIPAVRQAIGRALADQQARASEGFRLTQAQGDETGVVVYRAVMRPPGQALGSGPRAQLEGVAFVTLRTGETLARIMATAPPYLKACLIDRDGQGPRALLAGAPDCTADLPAGHLSYRRVSSFGGRSWELMLSAAPSQVPDDAPWLTGLFGVGGLLFAGLLGMLLLSITGRQRRVEDAVAERTSDLRHEVQERRRAEERLRESEARWRAIVDNIPTGVVYADLEGRLREANPRLRTMLGLPPDGAADALARLSLARLLPGPEGHDRALLALLADTRGVWQARRQLQREGAAPLEVQVTLGLLRDTEGRPNHVVGVIEDVTEHLRLAQAERARESAEAASRAKSEFLSRISHELRTPLNAILGFGQLLGLERAPALTPRQREWNDQVQQAGWHLLGLINEMMDLARIESGEMRLSPQTVDPAVLLQECLTMLAPTAAPRRLVFEPVRSSSTRPVWVDPLRLRQILTNLLSNAAKYNREGGTVRCSVADEGDGVCIEVADEGEGLSAEQLAHLFEPFNRLGREHSGVEGTGLGLVISLRLAEAMGGQLQARSTPGQGSVFRLWLPSASADHGPDDAPAAAGAPVPARAPAHVLYIEDNETNAEVMRGVLAQRPWLSLEVAATGTEGLAAARARVPDLLLLDMHLPDMDGLEVLAHWRADPRLAEVPVLAVSADATQERMAGAQVAGVRGYVTKPVDIARLLALVDELI
ncbi:MASE1 domain-containing protein [Ideonella sp. 4Y11]|uniref:histidine kinase n=1 Tax=Ideonella aquatica TaxID=2824119 RepID=A0A940YVV3_9BURK|nr:ATP-binding protein [Ideonella aquatica]MBQ0960205.1 MASE1 domain-containing protein [Ideonella aquatica]